MNKRRIFLVIIVMFSIISISNNIYAALDGPTIVQVARNFATDGNMQIDETDINEFSTSFNSILMGVGLLVVVGVGVFLGIKFMTESAAGKAKVMDSLIPYIIGVVVVFGGFSIWKMAVKLVDFIGD